MRVLNVVEQIFDVDNFNTFISKVDYKSVPDALEILNLLLARRRQHFALELASFLVNIERVVNSLLILEYVVAIVEIYLRACLNKKESQILHLMLKVDNRLTQLDL